MKRALGPAAAFAAMTALTLLRLWPRWQTHTLTASVYDFGPNLWLQWWGPFALAHGLDPFFTRWMFHPAGSALTVDAWPLQWLLLRPLSGLLDPVGRYNALAAFSYLATGAASYLFYRSTSGSRDAALVAAVAFTFGSFRNYSFLASHCELLQTQWCALLLWALAACAQPEASWRSAPWLFGAALLSACSELRTFLMTMAVGAVYAAASWRPRLGLRLAAVAAALAAALWPLVMRDASTFGLRLTGSALHPDALRVGWRALLGLPAHHALRAVGALGPAPAGWAESNEGYLGAPLLLLAAAGLPDRQDAPRRRPWLAALAVSALLEAARWPLAALPVLSFLRVPARFSMTTALVLGVFAARGWERLESRLRAGAVRRVALALLCAWLFVETNPVFQAPLEVSSPREPALDALRSSEGAVLDLPLPVFDPARRSINYRAFARAVRHERPLVNGHLSAPDAAALEQFARRKDLASLLACQTSGACASVDGALSELRRSADVRYVICDTLAPADPLIAYARRSRALRPVGSGQGFELFEVRPGGRLSAPRATAR